MDSYSVLILNIFLEFKYSRFFFFVSPFSLKKLRYLTFTVDFNKKANKNPEEVEAIDRTMNRLANAIGTTHDDVHKGEDWPVVNRDCDDVRAAAQALKDVTHAAPLAAAEALRKVAENLKNEANGTHPDWQVLYHFFIFFLNFQLISG